MLENRDFCVNQKYFLELKIIILGYLDYWLSERVSAGRNYESVYLCLFVQNVKDKGACSQVIIPNTKTKVPRKYSITSGNIDGMNLVEVVRKYIHRVILFTQQHHVRLISLEMHSRRKNVIPINVAVVTLHYRFSVTWII